MLKKLEILFLSIVHRWKYKPYRSIDFLPIWNFKQIERTGDHRYLIKNVDYEQMPEIYLNLQNIWDKIYDEYANASGPDFLNEFKKNFVTIEAKRREYIVLAGCIKILAMEGYLLPEQKKTLINIVRELGYRFNDSTENHYYNSILALQSQLMGLRSIIEKNDFDFENKYLNKKPEYVDIEEILSRFTQAFGPVFDSHKMTTKQYIIWLHKYNKFISDQRQNQEKWPMKAK